MPEQNSKKIYIATDHAGFEFKGELVSFLTEQGYEVIDLGAHELNESDDYPDMIALVAEKVSSSPSSRGIILGGSGQGEAMVANRFKNVRAVVYYGGPPEIIKLSREHNDANVLSLGARFMSIEEARGAVALWLSTNFSEEERHIRRIKKIDNLNII